MPTAVPLPGRRARTALLACAAAALAACADHQAPTAPLALPGAPGGTTVLHCTANVANPAMECVAAGGGGAQASVSPGGGPSLDTRTVGGQGWYVRLASSGTELVGGVYSLDVTVQNLSNVAMATADGTTGHAGGVRVFLTQEPAGVGGDVSVANATGQAFFTSAQQDYFQYGGTVGGVEQGELAADGVLSPGEVSASKKWQFNVAPTVTSFSFLVYISAETPAGAMQTMAPQVTSVSPATLVPGATATLTGINFNPMPGANTVRIGGVAATVQSASTTQLQVTVPCVASGSAGVQVTQAGMTGIALAAPLQAQQRTLQVGQAAILSQPGDVGCNELPATGGAARYVVAIYNTGTDPAVSTGIQIAGDPAAPPAPVASVGPGPSLQAQAADPHAGLLEKNRRAGERLQARFRGDARMRPSLSVAADPVEPPLTRTIRVSNINAANLCASYYTVSATRVYYSGKLAIYEDDATPADLRASANASMAAYYQKIGDEYNADMEPIVRTHFGDPLQRDAQTDNNGVLVALFTPVINNNFGGVAGFVVSCDQFPNDGASNAASNHGEYFYAYQPTVAGTGYASFTPDEWYRTIRATFIHETKHVASFASRVTNGATFWEHSWLEEGTARHAEEVWARTSIYNVAWKANTGYGSAAAPGSVYCDVRVSAACIATNPRRPSLNMQRHFSALYTFLGNPARYSPFGRTPLGGTSFYASSWSLNRYAIDRYAASDAAFLSALTQSTLTGADNLVARAGAPLAEIMGGWALSLYADDYPGITADASIQMPTWNFPSIYAGLKADFAATYPRAQPIVPQAVALGAFAPLSVSDVYGGGVVYYELSGTHTQAQLLSLTGAGGGALGGGIRMAIARLQ